MERRNYDTERELWSLRLNIKDSSILWNQLWEKVRENKVLELMEEYNHLKNLLKIKRMKKGNRHRREAIDREMYRLGYITVKKLIEEK